MAGERELSELLLFSAEEPGANEHAGFAGWGNNSSCSPCFVIPPLFSSAGCEYLSRYFVKWNDLLSSERACKSGTVFDKNTNKPTKVNPTVGFLTTRVKTNKLNLFFLWEDVEWFLESCCNLRLPIFSFRINYLNSYRNYTYRFSFDACSLDLILRMHLLFPWIWQRTQVCFGLEVPVTCSPFIIYDVQVAP